MRFAKAAITTLLRERDELYAFTFACAKCGKPARARASVHWDYLARRGTFDEWRHDECCAQREVEES